MDNNNDATLPNKRLPPRQEQAAQLLAKGKTQIEAGRLVGVVAQTMWTWYHDADFQARVEFLRSEPEKQADEILEMGVVDAARVVVSIADGTLGPDIDDDGKPDMQSLNTRLRAALYLLDRSKKGASIGGSVKSKGAPPAAETIEDDEADGILDRMSKPQRK